VLRIGWGHPVNGIKADLDARGIPVPSDGNEAGQWYDEQIRRIARNPVYMGMRKWTDNDGNVQWLKGNWEPIVTEAEHLAAVRVLDGRKSAGTRSGRYERLLTYIATCPSCGGPECAAKTRKGGRCAKPPHDSPLRVFKGDYRCSPHGCAGVYMAVADLDMWVEGQVLGRLCDKDVIGSFLGSDDAAAEAATAEAEKLEAELEAELAKYARGEVTDRMMKARELHLDGEIKEARARASRLALPGVLRPFAGILGQQAAVWGLWETTPLAAKRDIIRALAASVVLLPGKRSVMPDERVRIEWRAAPGVMPKGSRSEAAPGTFTAPSWLPGFKDEQAGEATFSGDAVEAR
jgi:Recombinase